MSKNIASLSVDLRASTKGMRKDIDKAMKRTRKTLKTGFKIAFAGAVAGASAIGVAIATASKRIDELAKTSAKLGVTTESLRAMQQVAQETGTDFNLLQKSLQNATVKISEAVQGTGLAADALKELNLNAKELNQLAPDKQFEKIADALQNVANKQDKLRIVTEIYGARGASLINMLNQGSEASINMADLLEDLGVSLSRLDASKVEMANDAFGRISLTLEGVTNQLAIAFAPIIKGISEELLEASKNTGGFREEIFKMTDGLVKGFGWVSNFTSVLKRLSKLQLEWISLLSKSIMNGFKFWKRQAIKLYNFIISIFNKLRTLHNNAVKPFGGVQKELIKEIELEDGSDFSSLLEKNLQNLKNFKENIVEEFKKPLPSIAIDNWYENVKSKTEQVALEIEKTRQKIDQKSSNPIVNSGKVQISNLGDPEKSSPLELLKGLKEQENNIFDQYNAKIKEITNGEILIEQDKIAQINALREEHWAKIITNRQTQSEILKQLELEKFVFNQSLRNQESTEEEQKAKDKFDLQKKLAHDLTSIAANTAGRQSGIYKAMFAISKAFNIAEAIMAIQKAKAKAVASGTWPYNLAAMAQIASVTASIIPTIMGTNLSFLGGGQFSVGGSRSGGVDGKGGVNFTAHPNETVSVFDHTKGNPHSNSQPVNIYVNVNNNASNTEARVTERTDGNKRIIEVLINKVEVNLAKKIRTGGTDLTKSLEDTYTLRRGFA